MRNLFVILIVLFSVTTSYAGKLQNRIDDLQGKAYKYLADKRYSEAGESFLGAGELSKEDRNWQGCIDAAFGLISLKEFTAAQDLIEEAGYLIKFDDDWRTQIVLADVIIALPQDKRGILLPDFYLDKAYKQAKNDANWFGLLEIAKSYISLKNRSKAEILLQEALSIISHRKNPDACEKIAQVYERMDRYDQADRCRKLREKFNEFREKRQNIPPPKGWSPNTQTIAGNKPLERRDIPLIMPVSEPELRMWLFEQDRINRLQQQWVNLYEQYYNYPYGYQPNSRRFSRWLDGRNACYEYRDGSYIRTQTDF